MTLRRSRILQSKSGETWKHFDSKRGKAKKSIWRM